MEDVENMVAKVDEDQSNLIEFGEFLAIIKMSGGDEQTMQIAKFFKDLNAGVYGTREISFNLFVLQQRRKYLMAAIMGANAKFKDEDGKEHEYSLEMQHKGQRIMVNVKNILDMEKAEAMRADAVETGEAPETI